MVRCADDSLYTGITTDVNRRIAEHNDVRGIGAKYTRNRQPVVLVHQHHYADRSEATREELRIKKLSRLKKEQIITAQLRLAGNGLP